MRAAFALVLSFVLAATACGCNTPSAKSPEPQAQPASLPAQEPAAPEGTLLRKAPGVNVADLDETSLTAFFQLINTETSACDKPHSLARSLADDPNCRDSRALSQFVADALASGATMSDVRAAMVEARGSLVVREINVEGRPSRGEANAPVTVVVFADFQCPICKEEAPMIRQAVEQFRGRARLVFKHFPLQSHQFGRAAALAAEAAHLQGKFWPMHDTLFAHQPAFEPGELLQYAGELGLDEARFAQDVAGPKAAHHVDGDRDEATKLDLPGTPSVFVNGRLVHPGLFGGTVAGYIDEALRRQ